MKILKDNIDKLVVNVKYTFKNAYEDQRINTLLNLWCFFDERESEIQKLAEESLETVLYSKYYWCTQYKSSFNQLFGRDAGLDQQQFRIIEEIERRLGAVDWEVIRKIEKEHIR